MDNSLDTTNTWLAIVAIATAAQALLFVSVGIMVLRLRRSITTTLEQFEQRHLAPLSSRAAGVADDLRDVLAGAREVENDVRAQLGRLDDAATATKHAVLHRVWPVVGLARAVSAAGRALMQQQPVRAKNASASRASRITTS